MASNSKLSVHQKAERKAMLGNLPLGSSIFNDGVSLTIVAIPDGSITRVFSSVKSDNEIKFRHKVGEYHALHRYFRDADGGMILPGTQWADTLIDLLGNE